MIRTTQTSKTTCVSTRQTAKATAKASAVSLAAVMMILSVSLSGMLYSTASAASLPDYCSKSENGEVTCTIEIIGQQDPAYKPEVAHVPQGASVVFKNTDFAAHTGTSTDTKMDQPNPEKNGIFDTGLLRQGETSEPIVLGQKGEYNYYCEVHPQDMRGVIMVEAAEDISGDDSSSSMKKESSESEKMQTTKKETKTNLWNGPLIGGQLPVTKVSSVGDVAYIVDGKTPKGGHDAFNYDGSGYKKITGSVQVDVNPVDNTGTITAKWTDKNGDKWRLEQTKFAGGNELYFKGFDKDGNPITDIVSDPVDINHYMHGTTGAGPPIEPTLFNYLSTWGPADVFKNGEKVDTYQAHMMITDGARDPETGKITKADKETPYSPKNPGDSYVNRYATQLHLVYHTPPAEKKTDNFPPSFETFTHLMFHNVKPSLPVTHVVGDNAYIVDGTTPKGGHDAFSYDGSGHKKLQSGTVEVDVDPVDDTGTITAEWTDNNGDNWRLEQTKFAGGNELYLGEFNKEKGQFETELVTDPVDINHYMHGTTGAGPPIEPTLFNYLSTWGPADVFKNGEKVDTYQAHMMITDGARNPDTGKITKADKETPYSPMKPGDARINHHAAQLHLVYHTPPAEEKTDNFPPPFETFTHLMFYDMDVKQPNEFEPQWTGDFKISTKMTQRQMQSPLGQFNAGVEPVNVQCDSDMQLVLKSTNDMPACITESHASKLVQRGWGYIPS